MNSLPFYTVLSVSVLITVIIVYFIASILNYHRRYIKLQKERMLAEIVMQENERKRIANDLHDSLGPLLATVKLNINSINVEDEDEKEIIQRAGKHLDTIIKTVRQISYNLLPNTLDRKGLTEALNEFASQITNQKGLHIDIQTKNVVPLDKNLQIHVFRILQEIIHNTIKHAKAMHLKIALNSNEENFWIHTQDDGIGFNLPTTKAYSHGFGLKSIESRVEILRGKVNLETQPGAGTIYLIQIPLK
jgi:signal transduction histidine kinase